MEWATRRISTTNSRQSSPISFVCSVSRGAVTANLCYRAVLETIENAEAVDRFEFLAESDVFEFEHWPLERRKVEEQVGQPIGF